MALLLLRSTLVGAVALCLAHLPAASEDALPDDLKNLTSRDAIAKAASTLAETAKDSVLLKDLLDKRIKGSDGKTIGTVKNFAVVPGGRLMAAIVELGDGTRMALPLGAIKGLTSASGAGLQVPITASEARQMGELKTLAEKVGGN